MDACVNGLIRLIPKDNLSVFEGDERGRFNQMDVMKVKEESGA